MRTRKRRLTPVQQGYIEAFLRRYPEPLKVVLAKRLVKRPFNPEVESEINAILVRCAFSYKEDRGPFDTYAIHAIIRCLPHAIYEVNREKSEEQQDDIEVSYEQDHLNYAFPLDILTVPELEAWILSTEHTARSMARLIGKSRSRCNQLIVSAKQKIHNYLLKENGLG